jgi:two-component system, OmpR family, sensor kinase
VSLPIRVRMTLWYAALLSIVVAGVGAFLVLALRSDLTGEIDRALRPATGQIALDYASEGVPEFRDSASAVLKGERAAAQLLDRDGRVIATFGDRVAIAPMIAPADLRAALTGQTVVRTRELGAGRQDFRAVARSVDRQGQRRVVVAAQSLAPAQRSVRQVVLLLLLALPAAVVATAAGGWALARRSLRPVAQMTSAAGAIGVDRLDERVPEPRTRDEIAQLAATLNTMLARIEQGVEEQRRLVADASHELRTPLAAMRSELDVSLRMDPLSPAAREILLSTREEVDRLSRTVDDLLTLAAADDAALDLRLRPHELAALAQAVVDELAPVAAARRVHIELEIEPVPIVVDPVRLAQAVRNVLANAIEFTAPDSRVRVSAGVAGRDGRLVIEDEGPGVPEELRERIFDRFFRADLSRTRATGGSGLGLAIAREIVAAHGGRVYAQGRARGAAFVIELPLVGGRAPAAAGT